MVCRFSKQKAKKRYIIAIEVKGWNIPVTKEWTVLDMTENYHCYLLTVVYYQKTSAMRSKTMASHNINSPFYF